MEPHRFGELGLIFQGLEAAFQGGVVVGSVGPAVGFGDAPAGAPVSSTVAKMWQLSTTSVSRAITTERALPQFEIQLP